MLNAMQALVPAGKLGYREDGSVGPVEGEVEFVLPNVVRLDLANGTQQGIMRVIIMPTPIDENTAWTTPDVT